MQITPSRTIRIGRSTLARLGYGAMRTTGPLAFGEPADRAAMRKVLRRAVELGVNFIDTADIYGPQISEQLIAEALSPYRDDIVIATKAGYAYGGPNTPPPLRAIGRPEYIFQQVELSLRNLKVEALDLWQLHDVDPAIPIEETLGAAARLQEQGKIKDIGLSNVTLQHIERARKVVDIVSVQHLFNIAYREQQPVVEYCEAHDMAFLPYFPLGGALMPMPDAALARAAARYGATGAQLCLAWLLHFSRAILPIPGTSSIEHLEENMKAVELVLTDEQWAAVEQDLAVQRNVG
jgi:aryl-alcohol dehydrogenase-like predicted oxidoreductase